MRMTVGRSWNDAEIQFPKNGPRQSVKSVSFRALPLFFFHSYFSFGSKCLDLAKGTRTTTRITLTFMFTTITAPNLCFVSLQSCTIRGRSGPSTRLA